MIADCREAGLPEPAFEQRGPHFVVTLWRDWATEEVMRRLGLGERQRKALAQLRSEGRLTNASYQHITGSSRQTASRDLDGLVEKGLIVRRGERRGTYYLRAMEMPQK